MTCVTRDLLFFRPLAPVEVRPRICRSRLIWEIWENKNIVGEALYLDLRCEIADSFVVIGLGFLISGLCWGCSQIPDPRSIPNAQTPRKILDTCGLSLEYYKLSIPPLPARGFLSCHLSGLHLTETVLTTGTQGTCKLTLSYGCLARNHGVADLSAVDTSTVGKARRKHLTGASLSSDNLGRGNCALDNLSIQLLVNGANGAWQVTYVGS